MKKITNHRWTPLKGQAWSYCVSCGLLRLKNDFTEWCVKEGCEYSEHVDYAKKRKYFTNHNSKLKNLNNF